MQFDLAFSVQVKLKAHQTQIFILVIKKAVVYYVKDSVVAH